MTARVWTKQELDIVHPLPGPEEDSDSDGWRWQIDSDGIVALGSYDDGDGISGEHLVYWRRGFLCSNCGDFDVPAPDDVALAVILASKGLDSMEALARVMDDEAIVCNETRDVESAECERGQALAWEEAATMLRRGTVKP